VSTLFVRRNLMRSGLSIRSLPEGCEPTEFTWGNDVALRSGGTRLSIESKAKTARFIDYVHSVPRSQQRLHPGNKLPRPKAPCCLGQQLIVLRHHHVLLRVDVQPELDDQTGKFLPAAPSSEVAPSL